MRQCLFLLAVICILTALPRGSHAGGLFMPGHGVRGLGRAGAFTAGGDDPGGIWYNPANIGGLEGLQLLIDGTMIFLNMDYRRLDSGGNLLPPVSNDGPILPIPNLAFSSNIGRSDFYWGASLSAPYSPTLVYPEPSYAPCGAAGSTARCIDTAHSDAPQRYSFISLEGTFFIRLDLALAYQIIEGLVIGVSMQNLFVNYTSLISISSYTGTVGGGPEDPEYDSLSQMKMTDLFNPSGKVGLIYQVHPRLKLGASFQLPFWVGGDSTVNVQLPLSPLFKESSVEGSSADVSLVLPLSLNVGVELSLLETLRIELGFDWENWSVLDAIRIHPKDIFILNLPSIDRYKVPDLAMILQFRDTFTLRLGGEYTFSRFPLTLRGGYIFESGAVDDPYASILAREDEKHVFTIGAGYTLAGFRLDLFFAHSPSTRRSVASQQSRSMQINPINPEGAVGVGGGTYEQNFSLFGLGLMKSF